MKHLDVVDGELAAVPAEERPAAGIIGQNQNWLYLRCDRRMLKYGQPAQQQLQRLDLVALSTKNISCSPTA